MDSKDRKIIEALRENSRAPIKEIAAKCRLRPSTVHQRIQRLISNKVIKNFTVRLDNRLVEENFIVFMLVATEHDIENRAFSDPCIKEVFGITGEYDLLIKMKFRDIEEFNSFVLKLRKDQGIKKTLTMVSTIEIKEVL